MPPTPTPRSPPQAPDATASRVHGVILAGGRGTRMGGLDKGLVSYQGQALVQRVAQQLSAQVASLSVSANRNLEHYARLGLRALVDVRLGFVGPLAGIEAALAQCHEPYLCAVPCDCLELPANFIMRMVNAVDESGAQAAHAAWRDETGGLRLEPLPCLLRCTTRQHLTRFLDRHGRSVRQWLQALPARAVEFDSGACFASFNTLESLREHGLGDGA